MSPLFRLFWLRETGCDAGTLLRADELAPEIQAPVLKLAEEGGLYAFEPLDVRLPYFDKVEWRQREELLSQFTWERRGREIRPMLSAHASARDFAAWTSLTDPVWAATPKETDPRYFHVWQSVSVALQRSLRRWIAEAYFEDIGRFDDRAAAFPVLAYETARLYHGRPLMEFTYDLHDYPHCLMTIAVALKMTGRALQGTLAEVESRLNQAGNPVLARRYAPLWYDDILRQVRARPRRFIELLAAERRFINAVITLGTKRNASGINHFAKASGHALHNVCGMDLSGLGPRALMLATDVLRADQDAIVEMNPHECLRTPQRLRPGME